MSSAITDLLDRVSDSTTGRPVIGVMAAPGKAIAATSINLVDATNWTLTTAIHFAIYNVTSAGIKDPTTQTDWKGTLAGTTISNLTLTGGTDRTYTAGAIIEITPTARWAKDLYDWGIAQHTILGAHGVVTATSVDTPILKDNATLLSTIRTENSFDYVASGGVWSGDNYGVSLNASMTALVCYINGQRGTINAVTARAFTASVDTYIDVLNNAGTFTLVYTTAATNAASPALAANSVRIGIIQAAATITAATKVNQGQEDRVFPIASSVAYTTTDSIGNLICPRDPSRKILGYRTMVATQTTTSTSIVQLTGMVVPVIVPVGRKVRITFYAYELGNTIAGANGIVGIFDGSLAGTQITGASTYAGSSTIYATESASAISTPSSTSKTYYVGFKASAGTTQVTSGATTPTYVLVELA